MMDPGQRRKNDVFIVDAQSVENTDAAELKGYEASKKASAIKRLSMSIIKVLTILLRSCL